jgi:hypothetical protein
VTASRAAASAFIIKLALACAALAGLGQVVAWNAIADAAAAVSIGWAALALALLPVNVGLEVYRFHRLLRVANPSQAPRFGETLAAVVGAYPLGLLTPGRLGDYAGRAIYLRDYPASATAALTFAERTATLACCLGFGAAALPFWLMRPAIDPSWIWVLPVAAAAAIALGTVILHPRLAARLVGMVLPFRRLRRAIGALASIPQREARTLLTLSAVRYLVFTTQFVLLLRAFAPAAAWEVSAWGSAAAGVALVFFTKSALPGATLGDLGIREGAAVYFLAAFGGAAAFNASLGVFAINLLLPALAGLPLVVRLRVGGREAAPAMAAELSATVPVAGAPSGS